MLNLVLGYSTPLPAQTSAEECVCCLFNLPFGLFMHTVGLFMFQTGREEKLQ